MKRAICTPTIRMLMREKNYILIWKCKEAGLKSTGIKYELAKRLAEHQEKELSNAWKVISGKGIN